MKLDEIGISKHYMAIVSPQRPGSGAKCCWGSLEPYSHFAMSSCSCPELLSPSLASGHCWGRSMHTGCQHALNTHRSLSSTHNFFFAELHQTFSKIALLIWYLLETKQQKNQLSLILGARIALGICRTSRKMLRCYSRRRGFAHTQGNAGFEGTTAAFQEQSWGGSLCV